MTKLSEILLVSVMKQRRGSIHWGFEEWCDFKNETFFESDEELPYGKNPNDNQGRGGCK